MAQLARLAWIVCITAACGRQPPPPGGGSTSTPPPPAPDRDPRPSPTPRTAPPDASPELCDPSECGPRLGMPNRRCPDGSIGGPTGRCLRHPDGKCGWEIRPCPP